MAKLKALLLTEGYHGMISQAEGMAKALNTEFHHKIVRLNWLWNYIPSKLTPASEIILKDKNYITESEEFDFVISCGRKSVIPSILLKKKNKNIFTIHIQDPKVNFNNFDIIIAPEHDGINGKNIITSKGAIHYITKEEIEKSKNYLSDKIKGQKIVALILGGPNKYYSFDNEEISKIFDQIKISFISKGYKVAVIPSMRTPKKIIQLAKEKLINEAYIVSEVDRKAYLSSFAIASSIIVTCDSTSMISEAAVSGKPIFIAHMKTKRNNYRFNRFFQLFRDMGITKNLGEKVEEWNYNNLNESGRIAELINQKLNR